MAAASDPAADRRGTTAPKNHAVLVGYGRVGRLVGAALQARGESFVVIEDSAALVAQLRESGIEAIVGNAVREEVLAAANVMQARVLLVAIPPGFDSDQVVERARGSNPGLAIVARADSDADVDRLTRLGADTVVIGERELARGMIERVLPAPAMEQRPG